MEPRNPLAIAINKNSKTTVKELLKQGLKLKTEDFYDAFVHILQRNNIDPEIINLLGTYQALPPDVSIPTIKLILFLEGNAHIQPQDFLDKPGLNLNGCPGLQTPMQIATRTGSVQNVKFLINAGVQERPLDFLFLGIHESHFQGLDLLEIDRFKKNISDNFSNKNSYFSDSIEEKCRIAELFIMNPTANLYTEIQKKSASQYGKFRLLPFFVWAAKNNRFDLLNIEGFAKLFVQYPEAAEESFKIAAVFDAKDYVRDAIMAVRVDAVNTAISIACASGNQEMLVCIVNTLQKHKLTLKDIAYQSTIRDDIHLGSIGDDEPLFWAIRCDNNNAITYLLHNGVDPNDYEDAFSGQGYLYLAIGMGNINAVRILIEHGANLLCKDKLQKTLLHEALESEQWDIAEMLIKDYHADIYATDYKKKTPLDYVEDQAMREKLLFLSVSQQLSNEKETVTKQEKTFFRKEDKNHFTYFLSRVDSATQNEEKCDNMKNDKDKEPEVNLDNPNSLRLRSRP